MHYVLTLNLYQSSYYNVTSYYQNECFIANKDLCAICEQCKSRSSCRSVQSDLSTTVSADETLIYIIENRVALRSDCEDVQADKELHCLHMTYTTWQDKGYYYYPFNLFLPPNISHLGETHGRLLGRVYVAWCSMRYREKLVST